MDAVANDIAGLIPVGTAPNAVIIAIYHIALGHRTVSK